MNDQQRTQLLNLLFGSSGLIASLLIRLGLPPSTTSDICQILVIVVPLAYAAWNTRKATSDHAVIASASKINGVKSIEIAPDAKNGAAKAADDPALPTVSKPE